MGGHGRRQRVRLTGAERATVWRDAAATAAAAAGEVRRLSATDPAAAADIAHATGRALAATARVAEGRAGGPLTAAADQYDRAARDLHGRQPALTRTGTGLRAVARLVALTGRAARDETTQILALVANLADLADAVAELRAVQERTAQAAAARAAADELASVSTRFSRPPGATEAGEALSQRPTGRRPQAVRSQPPPQTRPAGVLGNPTPAHSPNPTRRPRRSP